LLTAAVTLALAWRAWRLPGTAGLAAALALAVPLQVTLGSGTLLSHVAIAPAALHQAGALTVIGLLTVLNHRLTGNKGIDKY
ncbi:hypothetical protein ABTM11_20415, partial [Acinetobacter baumannii]